MKHKVLKLAQLQSRMSRKNRIYKTSSDRTSDFENLKVVTDDMTCYLLELLCIWDYKEANKFPFIDIIWFWFLSCADERCIMQHYTHICAKLCHVMQELELRVSWHPSLCHHFLPPRSQTHPFASPC